KPAGFPSDESAHEMEHCQIGICAFLPTYEDPTESVHPAVGSFDNPTSSSEAGLSFDGFGFFAPAADMGRETELIRELADLAVIVSRVGAGPWRGGPGGFRRREDDVLDRLACHLEVDAVGAVDGEADRNTVRLGQHAPFGSAFAAIRRVWPRFFPRRGAP